MVKHADDDEAGKDIARISKMNRPSNVSRHDIIHICANDKSVLVKVLGLNTDGIIKIDLDIRERLGLTVDNSYNFHFERANFWHQSLWQWSATDPAVRIPARIAAISLVLGAIGLVSGAISLFR